MRIKLAKKNTSCIVTSFYLTSMYEPHDEIDFEFLGGKSYELQTNVYSHGLGGREQKIVLWFDPTVDFHTYEILWNQYQIVFLVDTVPIRVFKNNSDIGVPYPWRPMQVEATMWEGDWSCNSTKADLSQAPFVASYQGFGIMGCPVDSYDHNAREHCYSPDLWWNFPKRRELDFIQKQSYRTVIDHHLTYDYCQDRHRYPIIPAECPINFSL
ncbi:Xyloglucan endotransglucosylase/hydrolase protein 2 [Linum grandiflorum]